TINGPFSSNTKLRIRCDASNNGDQIYIDDVVIEGCKNYVKSTFEQSISESKAGESETTIRDAGAENIIVSPNPFTDYLTIQLPKNNIYYTVQLMDMSGRILKSVNTREQISFNLQVHQGKEVTGMLLLYFIGDHHAKVKKVLKMK
ncbi:MAG: T9SS type A sorting domain-containing protein, partial [Bacteroidales bacterium]|nr:T9SS type A sorting domain-containing protein [Bacteroidales bacterium]